MPESYWRYSDGSPCWWALASKFGCTSAGCTKGLYEGYPGVAMTPADVSNLRLISGPTGTGSTGYGVAQVRCANAPGYASVWVGTVSPPWGPNGQLNGGQPVPACFSAMGVLCVPGSPGCPCETVVPPSDTSSVPYMTPEKQRAYTTLSNYKQSYTDGIDQCLICPSGPVPTPSPSPPAVVAAVAKTVVTSAPATASTPATTTVTTVTPATASTPATTVVATTVAATPTTPAVTTTATTVAAAPNVPAVTTVAAVVVPVPASATQQKGYFSTGSNLDCSGYDLQTCPGYGQGFSGAGQFDTCAQYCDGCAGCSGFGISNTGCWLKIVSGTHALSNSVCWQKSAPAATVTTPVAASPAITVAPAPVVTTASAPVVAASVSASTCNGPACAAATRGQTSCGAWPNDTCCARKMALYSCNPGWGLSSTGEVYPTGPCKDTATQAFYQKQALATSCSTCSGDYCPYSCAGGGATLNGQTCQDCSTSCPAAASYTATDVASTPSMAPVASPTTPPNPSAPPPTVFSSTRVLIGKSHLDNQLMGMGHFNPHPHNDGATSTSTETTADVIKNSYATTSTTDVNVRGTGKGHVNHAFTTSTTSDSQHPITKTIRNSPPPSPFPPPPPPPSPSPPPPPSPSPPPPPTKYVSERLRVQHDPYQNRLIGMGIDNMHPHSAWQRYGFRSLFAC
jgi:hypothetical protein